MDGGPVGTGARRRSASGVREVFDGSPKVFFHCPAERMELSKDAVKSNYRNAGGAGAACFAHDNDGYELHYDDDSDR